MRREPPFPKEDQDAYLAQFKRDFYLWYRKRYYIAPTLMLAVLTFFLSVVGGGCIEWVVPQRAS